MDLKHTNTNKSKAIQTNLELIRFDQYINLTFFGSVIYTTEYRIPIIFTVFDCFYHNTGFFLIVYHLYALRNDVTA